MLKPKSFTPTVNISPLFLDYIECGKIVLRKNDWVRAKEYFYDALALINHDDNFTEYTTIPQEQFNSAWEETLQTNKAGTFIIQLCSEKYLLS